MTRLLSGGYKDPQPGEDGINVEQSFIRLNFQGGYSDPSLHSEDDSSDEVDLNQVLRRAGFTETNPILFSVAAGRLNFRVA